MKITKLNDEISSLKNNIMSSSLIPVLGSGFSVAMVAKEGMVPSGEEMKQHMVNLMKK